MAKDEPWRAMCTAPKDGTLIIALYADLSGVEMIVWGDYEIVLEDGTSSGWFAHDYSDEFGDEWAGWIPAPDGTPTRKNPNG